MIIIIKQKIKGNNSEIIFARSFARSLNYSDVNLYIFILLKPSHFGLYFISLNAHITLTTPHKFTLHMYVIRNPLHRQSCDMNVQFVCCLIVETKWRSSSPSLWISQHNSCKVQNAHKASLSFHFHCITEGIKNTYAIHSYGDIQ